MASDYSSYLPRIEKGIRSDLLEVLRRVDSTLVPHLSTGIELGQVKDFGSLATASQNEGVAMKNSTRGTAEQRTEADEEFSSIAKRIINLT